MVNIKSARQQNVTVVCERISMSTSELQWPLRVITQQLLRKHMNVSGSPVTLHETKLFFWCLDRLQIPGEGSMSFPVCVVQQQQQRPCTYKNIYSLNTVMRRQTALGGLLTSRTFIGCNSWHADTPRHVLVPGRQRIKLDRWRQCLTPLWSYTKPLVSHSRLSSNSDVNSLASI